MIKSISVFFTFLLLVSCNVVKHHNKKISMLHSIKDLHLDIDKAFNSLKRHHPKLYQYINKDSLDYKIDSLKRVIDQPINSKVFYNKIAPVLASIRQGHISISPQTQRFTKKEYKRIKKKTFEFYDIDFAFLDSKLWVVKTRGKDRDFVGSEVLKIDNDSVSKLIKQYRKTFTSDGYNTTLYNNALGRYFKHFYYKDKGFLNQLEITFKKQDVVFKKLFKRVPKKTNEKDSLVKKNKPYKHLKKKKRRQGYMAKLNQYTRNMSFLGKDSLVAYVKIRSFTNGPYRTFYKSCFEKIENKNCQNLILDLRDNGGGRVAEIDYLFSYLSNTPYQFTKQAEVTGRLPAYKYIMSNKRYLAIKAIGVVFAPVIIAHNLIKTHKKSGKIYYKLKYARFNLPKLKAFKGRIYVLINGNSFSASSLISTHLKATQRAVFVGEETGGAYNGCVAGIYRDLQLPKTKLNMRFGLMQIETPYTQHPDGFGVKPNVIITPTITNYLANEDPQINWVLNDIYK